jgi:[ribosomal protein S18]-alanine N-acetyltransferase
MRRRKPVTVHIRWMIRRDMPEVLAIEKAAFPFRWTEEDFIHYLRKRNCIGMVAELPSPDNDGKVAGFMLYELYKSRLEIINFAVDPKVSRRTVGAQMVAKLVDKLSSHRRTHVALSVRENNLPAHLFFRSQGFLAVEVLRGHYEDSGEDGYRFVRRFQGADEASDAAGNRLSQYQED